jgi:hypothetical protein
MKLKGRTDVEKKLKGGNGTGGKDWQGGSAGLEGLFCP